MAISTDFFTFQTPALLFPAISVLLMAYINRFLGITNIIRKLHDDMKVDINNHDFYLSQIESLSDRIGLIVSAKKAGILSLMCCMLSMIVLVFNRNTSIAIFAVAMICMGVSLIYMYKELTLSDAALKYVLKDCFRLKEETKK